MARKILVDGTVQEISPENGKFFSLEELQNAVGGIIEMVNFPNNHQEYMYVDEEGLLKQKPFNLSASMLAGQHIVGDVIILTSSEEQMDIIFDDEEDL